MYTVATVDGHQQNLIMKEKVEIFSTHDLVTPLCVFALNEKLGT